MSYSLPTTTAGWDALELARNWFDGIDTASNPEASQAVKDSYNVMINSLLHENYTVTPDHKTAGSEGGYGSNNVGNTRPWHGGLDVKAVEGKDVFAVESGTVVDVNINNSDYNQNVVSIQSSSGKIWIYGHVKGTVTEGDTISAGTKVGDVWGDGGAVDQWGTNGPYSHIHFQSANTMYPYDSSNTGWGHFSTFTDLKNYTTHPLQAFSDLNTGVTMTGTSSADNLTGTSGNDIIKGLAGYDILKGVGGNDNIYGGNGNDELYGGAGADHLYGDDGSDKFIFTSKTESNTSIYDTIHDFVRGSDKVDLSAIDANETVSGDQSFTYRGSATGNTAGDLDYDSSGGWLRASTDNNAGWDVYIKIDSGLVLDASDFIL